MSATLNVAAYRFVPLDDLAALRRRIHEQAAAAALRGTVLLAPEGINLFLAGNEPALRGFIAWLGEDPRFSGLTCRESRSAEVPFGRLKVKVKAEIIAFRRAYRRGAHAPPVTARTLQRWLDAGHDDEGRPVLLLDTRNREEVAHGTFRGALSLPIDDFVALPGAIEGHRATLAGATVVSFCTGGIRCEKAAPWLSAEGYGDIRQLEGGILGYFEQVGGAHFEGACFVFDERVALGPDLAPAIPAPAMLSPSAGPCP